MRIEWELEYEKLKIKTRINSAQKKWFSYGNKIRDDKKIFVSVTKNFAAATKRFVDRTKHFVVVTKYVCYSYFNK